MDCITSTSVCVRKSTSVCVRKKRTSEGQHDKSTRTTDPEEALAHYTLLLAIFTCILAVATIGLGVATLGLYRSARRQLKLAREGFTSTHRPKLRLKHIWFASEDGQKFVGRIESGKPITVRLDIVNVGSTEAFITVINFMTVIIPPGHRLPQRPPYNEPGVRQFHVGGIRLGSGITFTHPVSDGCVLSPEELQAIRNPDWRLYFVGTI